MSRKGKPFTMRSRQRKPSMLVGKWKTNASNTTWFTGGEGMTLTNPSDGYWAVTYDENWNSCLFTDAVVNSSSDLNIPDGYATVYDCDESGAIVVVREFYDDAQPGNIENAEVSFMVVLSDTQWDLPVSRWT